MLLIIIDSHSYLDPHKQSSGAWPSYLYVALRLDFRYVYTAYKTANITIIIKICFWFVKDCHLRIWTNSWNSRSFTVKHMSKKLPAWMLVGRILGLLFIATRSVISRCPGNVCFVLCIYRYFSCYSCVCVVKKALLSVILANSSYMYLTHPSIALLNF